jgi:hypothetical protein
MALTQLTFQVSLFISFVKSSISDITERAASLTTFALSVFDAFWNLLRKPLMILVCSLLKTVEGMLDGLFVTGMIFFAQETKG